MCGYVGLVRGKFRRRCDVRHGWGPRWGRVRVGINLVMRCNDLISPSLQLKRVHVRESGMTTKYRCTRIHLSCGPPQVTPKIDLNPMWRGE